MSGNYRDLKVWQKALDLTLEAYRCTGDFPRQEFNELTDQMRRAAVSIASNIAEDKGRSTDRDFVFFLCHARGSLNELETQTLIARRSGYLTEEASRKRDDLSPEIGKMPNGLI
jgi:four helix bundle protein